MANDSLKTSLQSIARIVTQDVISAGALPEAFTSKFEVKSYRNAVNLLNVSHGETFHELINVLSEFEIRMDDILASGGNKSNIAKNLEAKLHPLGWNETRISGDLIIRKRARVLNKENRKSKFITSDSIEILDNFLDGHQIDFVKGRVAFDLEWNSKDQTFDRDLYAMRAFYEAGIIDVGIILTRSSTLSTMLADIAGRIDKLKKFKEKYGASTTWMGKLDYRINAGRAGGCPILALGFEEPVFSELKNWREANPIVDAEATAEALMASDSVD